MLREARNVGASVRARLLARARAEKTDYQIILTRYALERLLYRLSVSTYRDGFILKGALLFVTWLHDRSSWLWSYDVETITDTFQPSARPQFQTTA